ncbi:MAG: type secretion system secreted protein Hcp [Acidimicrobiia bacterium]|jgi:type VI protein secretion system component Hcp|nr:type secretion system secreted protein Hcp [Acidimicrobiia bacterium]
MALEQFIEIAGIAGEASAPDVRGAIPVLSWAFGVTQPAVEGMRSVADFSGFRFTKRVDSSTPLLFALCAQSVTAPQAKLVVRSTGHRDPRVVIDLRDVLVAEVSATFDQTQVELIETVSLRFGRVWFGGAVIDRRGTSEQVNWFAWDLAQNRPASGR